jgi:drug/metabolite transporter (DMT)-like permease
MPAPANLRAVFLMVGAMALFASMDALNKSLTQGYPIPQILAVRFALFVAFACLIAKRGPWLVFETKAPWWQALRTAVLLVEMVCFILAFKYLPLAEVHAVAAAAPLLATATAAIFLKEKVDPVGWGLVVGGMLGALLVIGPGFQHLGPAMWIAVLAMATWGIYQTLTRLVAGKDSTDVTTLHTPLVGLVLASGVAYFDWRTPDAAGWFWLIASGTLGAFAHICIVRALAIAPASALQPYNYLLVAFVTLLGWLIYGDVPGMWTIIGAIVICACGIAAMRRAALAAKA